MSESAGYRTCACAHCFAITIDDEFCEMCTAAGPDKVKGCEACDNDENAAANRGAAE